MKILLIEDEVKLAEYLRKGLGEASYVVDIAYNGVDGLHMALEGSYDLLVLDAMLPGIDGLSQDQTDSGLDVDSKGPRRGSGIGTQDGCRRLSSPVAFSLN